MSSIIQKTKDWLRHGSGLIIPDTRQEAYQCGYCPNHIFLEYESNNRLFITGGKPVCVKCRILNRSKFSRQILKDKVEYVKDQQLLSKMIQKASNDHVAKVAQASQQNNKSSNK